MNKAVSMKYMMRIAIAAIAFPAAAGPAFAEPPCSYATTNVPWGTIDSVCAGNGGGQPGPDRRITEQAHLNWPNFHAPVGGSTAAAANQDQRGSNVPAVR